MKMLAILGSTGSIGRNTLDIVRKFPEHFKIKTLTAKNNVELLAEQIQTFFPEQVAVYDVSAAQRLQRLLPSSQKITIMHGREGYCAAAAWNGVDMTVSAMVGAAGLEPTISAIKVGKDIAIANKETLVIAGEIVTKTVEQQNIRLLPIDSEHSAIFQCLSGQRREDLEKIILTASGGPFLNTSENDFNQITPDSALKHPNWEMGAKITIDSATLMNKGLEVIEAKWLFNIDLDQIEVLVHPQSIIHSMVAYCDGSMLAQMGIPDMQEAIGYALSFPERIPLKQSLPDLVEIGALTFQHPDIKKFPCLQLAFDACRNGGSMPAVLNAANEVAVEAFLSRKIPFTSIPKIIESTMNIHNRIPASDLETVMETDKWARIKAQSYIAEHSKFV